MRRSRGSWVLFLAAALLNSMAARVTDVQAAEYKLGYIDSQRIFKEFPDVKTAQGQLNQDLEGWIKQLEAKKADIDKLQRDFESQRLMLSDARRKEKEDEILARQSEYAQLSQDIWGPTGKVAQRNEQLSAPLAARIKQEVDRIADADGYSIIFDAADGNMVFGEASLDLTDRVIQALKTAPEGTTAPH
jgi:outer membrane protein